MSKSAQRAAIKKRVEEYPSYVRKIVFPGIFKVAKRNFPPRLMKEVHTAAKYFKLPVEDVMALNLDYEFGGGACTTAAVPGKVGYDFVRALDWDVPPAFIRTLRWAKDKVNPNVRFRKVDGYVGYVTAHNTKTRIGVALNQSAGWPNFVNPLGQPITWHIRQAMEVHDSLDRLVDYFLAAKSITGGFIILVSPERAVWMKVTGAGGTIMDEAYYPEPLCVCNDNVEGMAERSALTKWSKGSMFKKDIPFPVLNADTADLVHIKL